MFNQVLLALAACSTLTFAVPYPQREVAPYPAHAATVLARAADVDACPGYTASNVVTTDSTLTADLTLAGDACNVYSDDIKDLKLLVEYQTGKCSLTLTMCIIM